MTTATIDQPTSWPDPNLDGIHVLTQRNTDYLKRIHWWVRLFGVVWIVIPVVAFLAAVGFGLGMISMSRVNSVDTPAAPTAFAKCITEGYKASECARWYPN